MSVGASGGGVASGEGDAGCEGGSQLVGGVVGGDDESVAVSEFQSGGGVDVFGDVVHADGAVVCPAGGGIAEVGVEVGEGADSFLAGDLVAGDFAGEVVGRAPLEGDGVESVEGGGGAAGQYHGADLHGRSVEGGGLRGGGRKEGGGESDERGGEGFARGGGDARVGVSARVGVLAVGEGDAGGWLLCRKPAAVAYARTLVLSLPPSVHWIFRVVVVWK